MRYIFILLILTACSKSVTKPNSLQSGTQSSSYVPSFTKISTVVESAGNFEYVAGFNVSVEIPDPSNVKTLALSYDDGSNHTWVDNTKSPKTGDYLLQDIFTTQTHTNRYYHVEIQMMDNTIVKSDSITVTY